LTAKQAAGDKPSVSALRPPPLAADAMRKRKKGDGGDRFLAVNQPSAGVNPDGGKAE
jgi:hypothetical protein